jgi:hypothetical protein
MSEILSRREALLSLTAGVSAGLAGCSLVSSSDSGDSVGCSSFDFSNTRPAPLSGASVAPVPPTRGSESENAKQIELRVWLNRAELESSEAAAVNVYNPYDEVQNPRYTVPLAQNSEAIDGDSPDDIRGVVTDETRVLKTKRIGVAPISGEFRVAVEDSTGGELAAERFSFDCELSPPSEEGF